MIEFRKFPEIVLNGKRLVWDSRQSDGVFPERVFFGPSTDDAVRSELRGRPRVSECVDDASSLELGLQSAEALGHPSRRLKVIGITGTNGKTSGTHIVSFVLASLGKRVMQIGTLGVQIWEAGPDGTARIVESIETGFTTPEAPSLQDLFHQATQAGVTHVVMEVSSHALVLGRTSGVDFDVGIFTNLSQDHLDFHETMEDYGAAKRLLFERELAVSAKSRKFAVIGVPDEISRKLFLNPLRDLPGVVKREIREGKDFRVRGSSLDVLELEIGGRGMSSHLIGRHNAWNLTLSFMALAALEGITLEDFEGGMRGYLGVPGRLERVGERCFVDYAHTPDALEKTLSTLREAIRGDEKLVVVFGCGGDRDRGKRSLMGDIAGRLADVVWVTDDNPRTEDPASILEMIRAGVSRDSRAEIHVHGPRAEAISQAIRGARRRDVIAVCGKGHENYQIIGTVKHPFSDQDCIRNCLRSFADFAD